MARLGDVNRDLRKFVAPEFVFGEGARLLAGRFTRNLGAGRALVVSDPGVRAAGWAQEVEASLAAEGVVTVAFDAVSPNPRDHEVMNGAAEYQETGCDAIVAVGGGSVLDCAKGIGLVATNQRSILQFEGVDRVGTPLPPLVCVPTTAGTSADVSQFAIILDTVRRVKIAIISKALVPDVALVDPVTLLTMDADLTGCTGMDALTHAVEAYASNASSHFTDLQALDAIRLLARHLPPCLQDLTDLDHRAGVMLASLEAGLAFSNASLGAVHAMAHSLGGLLDLPHGECNAMLLPHVVSYNFAAAPERYRAVGEALGMPLAGVADERARREVTAALQALREATGTTATLGDRGVRATDLPALAELAMRDPCIATNPRRPTAADLQAVYEEALS